MAAAHKMEMESVNLNMEREGKEELEEEKMRGDAEGKDFPRGRKVHKGLRVGLVYLAGVLAGSLASSIFDPLKSLVGASGGVYALMGGYFMNVIVNFREMIPALGIIRLLVIILIVASDMGFALYRRFFVPANGSPVSFAAHIAGGFAGMSVGYTVFSCFDKTLLKDPRFWIAIAAYVACLLFAVFFNIFLSPAN